MSLSEQTKLSIDEACEKLREAISFASRADEAMYVHELSKILMNLTQLQGYNKMMSYFQEVMEKHANGDS